MSRCPLQSCDKGKHHKKSKHRKKQNSNCCSSNSSSSSSSSSSCSARKRHRLWKHLKSKDCSSSSSSSTSCSVRRRRRLREKRKHNNVDSDDSISSTSSDGYFINGHHVQSLRISVASPQIHQEEAKINQVDSKSSENKNISSVKINALGVSMDNLKSSIVDNIADNASKHCSICWENEKCIVLIRCGHLFCFKCIYSVFINAESRELICPTCRQSAVDIMRIFAD